MKKIILFLSIVFVFTEAKMLSIVQYDPFKRTGVLLKKHPKEIKKEVATPKRLSVDAILNKKAHINGKFYSKNSTVYGYRILEIKDHYIKVKKGSKISIIPLIGLDNVHLKGVK